MTALALAWLLALAAPAEAILVTPLSVRQGADPEVNKQVTATLVTACEKSRRFSAVHVQPHGGEPGSGSPGNACEDVSCLSALGAGLGARYVLTGSVGRVGRLWALNLRILDSASARAIATVSRNAEGTDTDALLALLPGSVDELIKALPAAPATVQPAPEPVDAAASMSAAPAEAAPTPQAAEPRPSAGGPPGWFRWWLGPLPLVVVGPLLSVLFCAPLPFLWVVANHADTKTPPCGAMMGLACCSLSSGCVALGATATLATLASIPRRGMFDTLDKVIVAMGVLTPSIVLVTGTGTGAAGVLGILLPFFLPEQLPADVNANRYFFSYWLPGIGLGLALLGAVGATFMLAALVMGAAPWRDSAASEAPSSPGGKT